MNETRSSCVLNLKSRVYMYLFIWVYLSPLCSIFFPDLSFYHFTEYEFAWRIAYWYIPHPTSCVSHIYASVWLTFPLKSVQISFPQINFRLYSLLYTFISPSRNISLQCILKIQKSLLPFFLKQDDIFFVMYDFSPCTGYSLALLSWSLIWSIVHDFYCNRIAPTSRWLDS